MSTYPYQCWSLPWSASGYIGGRAGLLLSPFIDTCHNYCILMKNGFQFGDIRFGSLREYSVSFLGALWHERHQEHIWAVESSKMSLYNIETQQFSSTLVKSDILLHSRRLMHMDTHESLLLGAFSDGTLSLWDSRTSTPQQIQKCRHPNMNAQYAATFVKHTPHYLLVPNVSGSIAIRDVRRLSVDVLTLEISPKRLERISSLRTHRYAPDLIVASYRQPKDKKQVLTRHVTETGLVHASDSNVRMGYAFFSLTNARLTHVIEEECSVLRNSELWTLSASGKVLCAESPDAQGLSFYNVKNGNFISRCPMKTKLVSIASHSSMEEYVGVSTDEEMMHVTQGSVAVKF